MRAEYCPAVTRYKSMMIDETTTPKVMLVSNTTVIDVAMARNCMPVSIVGLSRDTSADGTLSLSPYLSHIKSVMVTAPVFLPK